LYNYFLNKFSPESGAARFNIPISFVVLLSKTVDGRLKRDIT
jgi:hypothetical protein